MGLIPSALLLLVLGAVAVIGVIALLFWFARKNREG